MKDTSPKMERLYIRLIMEKTGQERLHMGCSMFDAAKQIVKSAIYEKYPDITPEKMKEQIFLRFYGQDFNKTAKNKILKALNA